MRRYSPLSDNGQRFLNALNTYVQGEAKLNGRELRKLVKELEAKYYPVFSSSKYIGCKGKIRFSGGFGFYMCRHLLSATTIYNTTIFIHYFWLVYSLSLVMSI